MENNVLVFFKDEEKIQEEDHKGAKITYEEFNILPGVPLQATQTGSIIYIRLQGRNIMLYDYYFENILNITEEIKNKYIEAFL